MKRVERLQILLDMQELDAVDTFRFTNRLPSRAAALRELLRRGLSDIQGMTGEGKMLSQDYGVLDQNTRKRDEN